MKASEQTILQTERFLKKVEQKFPPSADPVLTDIHVRVAQDTGDMIAYDDNDDEITRCVVEQWIDAKDDDFYQQVAEVLRQEMKKHHACIDSMSLMKPFSFVLEDEDKENIAELYVADDDTVIIGGDLMKGLDADLDHFFDDLMKE
ncbi:MAG: hypothetical protein PUG09_09580 [Prevotella sp.]|jgi:hypothetical protein|nr:hypothetical protein [Prevotella sp.]